jgi:hypothetical protein
MIPFEELSAALDQWRLRNGLPVGTTDVPSSPVAARAAAPAPAAWAPAPAPAPIIAPAAAATVPRPVSTTARPATDSDVLSLDDGDVEDEYANEGDDFSMNFSSQQQPASGNPVGSASGSIGEPEPAPAPLYDEEVGEDAYAEPPQDEYAAAAAIPELADDPAFDAPVAEAYEDEEESEEVWSKLRAAAGGDTIDSDVPEGEATVVGDHPKR